MVTVTFNFTELYNNIYRKKYYISPTTVPMATKLGW